MLDLKQTITEAQAQKNNLDKKKKGDEGENVSDESEDEDDQMFIPATHECSMHHGNKAVTALSVDPSGARLASGIYFNNFIN